MARPAPVVNTRVLAFELTGTQRYLRELLARLGDRVVPMAPRGSLEGARGHLWEQVALPAKLGGRLLWSPSNTGPLVVRRQVVTIHDLATVDHPEWYAPAFARWYGWLLPRLARRAAGLIAVSEHTRRRLLEVSGVAPERISVIYPGVDPRFGPADGDAIARARAAAGLTDRPYVLALGSLEPRKNLPRLLEAWRRIHGRLPSDVWLAVAGARGKPRVFGQVPLRDLPPRVHLTGRVDDADLPGLYSGALAFAYVSLYEGFGSPLVEAMAAGTPVLTADRTSMPEVVGDAAVTVDPTDPDAIGESMVRLLEDDALRDRFRRLGRDRAARFSYDRAAEATLQVLER